MPLPPRAARIGSRAARRPRFRSASTRRGRNCPMPGRFSLTAEATVDDKTATLSSSRLTAGPLGLAAAGRYDRLADRLDGTATVQSDAPGPLVPILGGVTWRGLQSHGARRTGQPGEAARRHGDAERRRRRSRGCRARRSFARLRSHHARRHARRAARRQPDARCAERDHGRGFRDGRRRLVPAQDRGRRGQGDGRAAQPGAVLGAGPTPARRARPSRPVGAARWRRPDVRLAGHA